MELCETYRIPHSQLMGASAGGRWTALDRAKAAAWAAWKADVCDGCGTRSAEWDEQQGGDRFAYVAQTSRCLGCELIEQEQEQVPDGAEGRGVRIGLIKPS
ncbi:hypothetical protein F4556_005057 [Kitasatospora gansuensis]|uniref:Uncharacterized protein n=1 Tax=Kitasatospora gansuensis TaxID=258050 RepID=A0A7W7SG84_9ACTN|nr:hypothetical protein [Kitasatospora gansuensis]MBB4949522.1 hypothetical protein [Kitasatospora gansuensis]